MIDIPAIQWLKYETAKKLEQIYFKKPLTIVNGNCIIELQVKKKAVRARLEQLEHIF